MYTPKKYIDSYKEELQKFAENVNVPKQMKSRDPFLVDYSSGQPKQILEEVHSHKLNEDCLCNYDDCARDFADNYFL